ncbi:MAG: hypothetical protein OEV59_05310 [Deltaproteobacteria bacterium]|nr:hypothetical protein [Deltaproteobacteria bacterium]
MSINDGLEGIVGKKISGIIAKAGERPPAKQVFLLFDDGTYFEFYGDDINSTKSTSSGGVKEVREYMSTHDRKIIYETGGK